MFRSPLGRSAGQLAEDVERYLSGLPVRARPDTLGYRTTKFVRRNRGPLAVAAVFAAMLTASASLTTLQARRLAAERDVATAERALAQQVSDILTGLFERSDPRRYPGGDTLRVAAFVEQGERAVEVIDDPALRAGLWQTLARIHAARGRYDRADTLLQRAHAELIGLGGADDPAAAAVFHERAKLRAESAGGAQGRPMLEESVARLRGLLGDDHPDVAAAIQDLALATEDPGERRRLLERALTMRERLGLDDPMTMASSLNALGNLRSAERSFRRARAHYLAAAGLIEDEVPADHPARMTVDRNLAQSETALGNYARAAELLSGVLERTRRVQGAEATPTANTIQGLALAQIHLGDLAAGERGLREAGELLSTGLEPTHPWVANNLRNLAIVVAQQGRLEEALELIDQAIALLGADDPSRPYMVGQRSTILLRLGRVAQAREGALASARALDRLVPEGHPSRADAQVWLGRIALAEGRWIEAAEHFEAALAMRASELPPEHPAVDEAACGAYAARVGAGREDETARVGAGDQDDAAARERCVRYARWGLADPMTLAQLGMQPSA